MKIAQKYSLALLLVACILQPEVQASASTTDTYGVVFHLFNPVPQRGAQKRIHHQLVEKALATGGDLNQAFMAQVKPFLLNEARAAFEAVATEQGRNINSEACAELLLQEKLEKPYFEKYGKTIYAQNPFDLPEHIFTYFVNPYLHGELKMHDLPEQTRDLSLVAILGYLQMVRIGLNYAQTGINITNEIFDKFGVPKP
jgi:hypothetical protein